MKIEKIEAYRAPNGSLYPSEDEARKAMVRSEIYDLYRKHFDNDLGGSRATALTYLAGFFEANHEKIYEIMKAASEKGEHPPIIPDSQKRDNAG